MFGYLQKTSLSNFLNFFKSALSSNCQFVIIQAFSRSQQPSVENVIPQ